MDDKIIRVVSVNGKYFLNEPFCKQHHIGDENVYTILDNQVYYHVTPEEIGDVCALEHKSFELRREPNLKIYAVIEDEKPDHEFDVYCYKDRNYVSNDILQKFHLQPLEGQIRHKGIIYFEVSPLQIAIVEGSSLYGIWKANYHKVLFES